MGETRADTNTTDGGANGPALEELIAELGHLRRQVERLDSDVERSRRVQTGDGAPPAPPSERVTPPGQATSRRHLLHLAGASAIGAVGGAIATGRPAIAADPNDVVKNIPNIVTDTTTLDGSFAGPVLSLFNRSGATTARGLYVYGEGASPAVRVDHDGDADAVAVAGNAPAGVDLHATGSGRIAMEDHVFGGGNSYAAGELHQTGGTVFAMVSEAVRRVVAAPDAAGSLFPIDPIRVYDSRLLMPFFGPLAAGQSRTIPVADARDAATGDVVESGAVPADATAIAFNLTVARTVGRGYLSVTPAPTPDPPASTINWATDDSVIANSSLVALGGGTSVSVYCGGIGGSTDFIVDVVGFYR